MKLQNVIAGIFLTAYANFGHAQGFGTISVDAVGVREFARKMELDRLKADFAEVDRKDCVAQNNFRKITLAAQTNRVLLAQVQILIEAIDSVEPLLGRSGADRQKISGLFQQSTIASVVEGLETASIALETKEALVEIFALLNKMRDSDTELVDRVVNALERAIAADEPSKIHPALDQATKVLALNIRSLAQIHGPLDAKAREAREIAEATAAEVAAARAKIVALEPGFMSGLMPFTVFRNCK